jgi:hypothetical protein
LAYNAEVSFAVWDTTEEKHLCSGIQHRKTYCVVSRNVVHNLLFAMHLLCSLLRGCI